MNAVVDVDDGNGDENTLTMQQDPSISPSIRREPDETQTSSTISNNTQNVLEEERPSIPISHHPRYRYRWMPKETTSPQTTYSKPSIFHPIPVQPSDHKSTSGSTSITWRKCPILPLHSHSALSNATILKRIIDVSQRETLARRRGMDGPQLDQDYRSTIANTVLDSAVCSQYDVHLEKDSG